MTLRRATLEIAPVAIERYARQRGLYPDTARDELLELLDGAEETRPAEGDQHALYRVRRTVGGAELDVSARVTAAGVVVGASVRTGETRAQRRRRRERERGER